MVFLFLGGAGNLQHTKRTQDPSDFAKHLDSFSLHLNVLSMNNFCFLWIIVCQNIETVLHFHNFKTCASQMSGWSRMCILRGEGSSKGLTKKCMAWGRDTRPRKSAHGWSGLRNGRFDNRPNKDLYGLRKGGQNLEIIDFIKHWIMKWNAHYK